MTERDLTKATDTELQTAINATHSRGEEVLTEKSGEWAKAGDIPKALDCARAALILYNERMAVRQAASKEWERRQRVKRVLGR